MLLLHPATGNSQRFHSRVPGLARHFRLIRTDLRGHGRSSVPPPEKPLTMDRLVADVEEPMATLGIGTAHVTENSAGDDVAQNLPLNAPEKVRSLAVVGPTPGLSPSASDRLPRIAREGLMGLLADTSPGPTVSVWL